MKELYIIVDIIYIDGWTFGSVEYALVEVKISNMESVLHLFSVDHANP